jgi:hypothetical protein
MKLREECVAAVLDTPIDAISATGDAAAMTAAVLAVVARRLREAMADVHGDVVHDVRYCLLCALIAELEEQSS